MNKQELISKISEKTGLTKADVNRVVDGYHEAVMHALKKGGDVRLVGFGTFLVGHRAATTGRNPRTGATIKIPASKRPKFRPGKQLVDAVN